MIRKLAVKGVTVFPDAASFHFVQGINVIVGGNDSGKSQLMKIAYALSQWSHEGGQRELPEVWAEEQRLRLKLLRVFGTRELSGLTARNRGNGYAEVRSSMEGDGVPPGTGELAFHFRAREEESGLKIERMPERFTRENAVFLSAREVLSLFPCYVQVGKKYPELIDGASWDMCRALETTPAPGQELEVGMKRVLERVEKILAGSLLRLNNRFFLKRPGQELVEMNLVAEGFKRLGTLGLLIQSNMVRRGTSLFWDEPEMNLNASHLPRLVKLILELCKSGVQVMLTSHSLFLLRELVLQLEEGKNAQVQRRFFGLQAPSENRFGVVVRQGKTLEEVGPLASLEAEIEQADRYLRMN